MFAGTPPLEALKTLLAAVTMGKGQEIMIADISRAFFYAEAIRPVYVKIPQEAQEPGDDNNCWELKMSLYGTRDAAANWHEEKQWQSILRCMFPKRTGTTKSAFTKNRQQSKQMIHFALRGRCLTWSTFGRARGSRGSFGRPRAA